MAIFEGSISGYKAEVDSNGNMLVNLPGVNANGVYRGGGNNNGSAMLSEVDDGTYTGTRYTLSPEVDEDYRMRVAIDNVLDHERFIYTTQNTSKHTFTFTTLAATVTAAGLTTNSGSITTINTGLTFGTFAMFPVYGTQTTVCETAVAFTAQPTANVIIDIGLFQRGASTAFAPLDGIYFRLTSAGMFGVINSGGTETTSAVFPATVGTGTYTYTNNTVLHLLIQTNNVNTTFWIDNFLYATIPTPIALNQPTKSESLPWSVRHAIVGGASGDATLKVIISDYRVTLRGATYADDLGTINNRMLGSYQGLSGNTMGQLIAGTVTSGSLVKPTAAIPVNTSLAANLPNSLGGRIYEQLSSGLAANVDGIFSSFTVPAGSTTVQGRRLKVTGIKLSGMVSTVVVGGPAFTEWYVAFGHTADSLATAESASMASATTKAPRRVMLPELTTNMTAAQAVGTLLTQPAYVSNFDQPIYVNPGERIALVGNKTISTAITSGVLSFVYQFIYSWE